MSQFLTLTSQYADARIGSINAARIMFGDCSFEVEQTTNAWAAVGVGVAFDAQCITLNIDPFASTCSEFVTFPINYSASVPSGVTVTWSVPNGWSTSTSGFGNTTLVVNSISGLPSTTNEPSFVLQASTSTGGSDVVSIEYELCDDCNGPSNPCQRESFNSEEIVQGFNDENVEKAVFSLFPNPAADFVNINLPGGTQWTVTVLGTAGQKIREVNMRSGLNRIEINRLPPGTYSLRAIEEETGRPPVVKRFIKQ